MFKIKNLINFLMPRLTIISMGGGSSSSTPTLTPEQTELLKAQTGFLTGTAFPAYQQTISGAGNLYGGSSGNVSGAANNASNVASQTGNLQQAAGSAGLKGGMSGLQDAAQYQKNVGQILGQEGASKLAGLFSPEYQKQQVAAALQPAMEQTREAMSGQNASYGAAGGLGSSRAALAQANLQSLSNQRMGTVAAQTQQGIEANRSAASQALLSAGQNATNQSAGYQQALMNAGGANLNAANQSAAAQIGYANAPMDLYSKYASIIYGTPQGSTTPNFSGTQGSNSSGKGGSFGFGK